MTRTCHVLLAMFWLGVPALAQAEEAADYFAGTMDLAAEASLAEACPAATSGECDCPACQAKKAAALKAAVAGAYAPLFYNNNFSYLNNPAYNDWHVGERFKQNPLGDCWTIDLGGQYRARYMGEANFRGLHLTGNDDDFLLHRTRVFANARYSDWFRAYAEYIDAESNYENFAPRAIEVNRSDMLNLFADARVWCGDCGDLWFRAGRQELLYGAERLISPLDWANTRRTFEGYKLFWQGEDWNVDVFATRPVRPDAVHFDSPDYQQEFAGAWGTYKAIENHTLDVFALQYNNDRGLNDFEFTSLGGRWIDNDGPWLWEVEGATQFGSNTDGSAHQAGFATGGFGRRWADHCWKPQLWCYYDWASGGDVLGAGNGFNHLFPLAHKYLGFMDLFGRSNIQSPNVQLTFQPHQRVKFLAWYYYLMLDTRADTPYSVVMTPVNLGNAPVSRDLGHEIDLLATITLNERMELLVGYSHFFAGDYYRLTPGLTYRGDADFVYVTYQWNF